MIFNFKMSFVAETKGFALKKEYSFVSLIIAFISVESMLVKGQLGGLREVNAINPRETFFPALTRMDNHEIRKLIKNFNS